MAGVATPCVVCEGKRFDAEVLEYRYGGKDISEVLGMSVAEAEAFFGGDGKGGGTGEGKLPAAHKVLVRLADAGVSARRGIMAAHRQPAHADAAVTPGGLPVTERLTDRTLVLPLFHEMTDDEQARVVDVLVAHDHTRPKVDATR